jgi:hypothetical protein
MLSLRNRLNFPKAKRKSLGSFCSLFLRSVDLLTVGQPLNNACYRNALCLRCWVDVRMVHVAALSDSIPCGPNGGKAFHRSR